MIAILLMACGEDMTDSGRGRVQDDSGTSQADICENPLAISFEGEGVIDFGRSPSYGDPIFKVVHLENRCAEDLIFLGEPDSWSNRSELVVESPPPLRLLPGESADLILSLYPEEQGILNGSVTIPTDRGQPNQIPWTADIGGATPLLMLSQDGHVALSTDYGNSIASWSALPGPETDRVRGLCYGNGRAVIVGGEGSQVIWSSFDGISWTRDESEGNHLNDCASNGDRFAAAEVDPQWSLAGLVWESGDGTPWMHDPLMAIAHYNGFFVAVGGQGRVAVTENGESWLFDESIGTFNLFALAQSRDRLIAAGQFGFVGWSENGLDWATQTVGTGIFQAAAFGDGVFLISDGATLFRSENGESWHLVGENGIKPLAATGKRFIGFGGGQLHLSQDQGDSWNAIAPLPFSSPIIDTVFMP